MKHRVPNISGKLRKTFSWRTPITKPSPSVPVLQAFLLICALVLTLCLAWADVTNPVAPAPAPADLPKAVQNLLIQANCLRGAADGQFGKGSRVALANFYKNADPALGLIPKTDPDLAVWQYLQRVSGRVCPDPPLPPPPMEPPYTCKAPWAKGEKRTCGDTTSPPPSSQIDCMGPMPKAELIFCD